jgi:hypothetical protein
MRDWRRPEIGARLGKRFENKHHTASKSESGPIFRIPAAVTIIGLFWTVEFGFFFGIEVRTFASE